MSTVKEDVVRYVEDGEMQDTMFRSGELDLINLGYLDSGVAQSDYKTAFANIIVEAPEASITYFALNGRTSI